MQSCPKGSLQFFLETWINLEKPTHDTLEGSIYDLNDCHHQIQETKQVQKEDLAAHQTSLLVKDINSLGLQLTTVMKISLDQAVQPRLRPSGWVSEALAILSFAIDPAFTWPKANGTQLVKLLARGVAS